MSATENLELYASQIGCTILHDVKMSEHTTFKIGGVADLVLIPGNEQTMSYIIAACNKWDVPYYVLGNGSNVLVSDSGVRGAVIFTSSFNSIELVDPLTVKVGAGIKNSQLCSFMLENSISGFEFLWGIPGTVGGAAFMNAGAYGGEIKDVFVCAECVTENGEIITVNAKDADYSYRHSVFEDNGYTITSVTLKGVPGNQDEIRAKMDELMMRRREKQPLEYPSAGSVFKRPEGYYAAALIEECEIKGESVGGAQVSEKHSGFIINTGNATASDVKILIEKIKEQVFLQRNIRLECEIRFID